MLVGHPDPHLGSPGHAEPPQPISELNLEGGRGYRVFAGVSLARHFQDSADFSQPIVNPFQAQLDPVLLA